MRSARAGSLLFLLCAAWPAAVVPAASTRYALSLESIEGPGFTARGVRAEMGASGRFTVAIDGIDAFGRTWRNMRVACAAPAIAAQRISCREAVLDADGRIPFSFDYDLRNNSLEAAFRPEAAEVWRIRLRESGGGREITAQVENGQLARLAGWLPAGSPRIGRGTLHGSVRYLTAGNRGEARLRVADLAFSDASGMHAGENLAVEADFDVNRQADAWRWRAEARWNGGEVFWQPLYLRAGTQVVRAAGTSGGGHTRVDRGEIAWPALGTATFSGAWDHGSRTLVDAAAESGRIAVPALYEQIVKHFLQGTAFGNLRTDGAVAASVQVRNGALHAADVRFEQVSGEDLGRRFALFGVTGRLPWHRVDATEADLGVSGGEVLRLPFGAARLPLRMQGLRFALGTVEVPLLDGKLTVSDFRTVSGTSGWRWRLKAALTPVSMAQFTQSLGLPTMHGTLSAEIPEVRYGRSTLAVDGALLFRVFDGTVTARNVNLIEPFGRAPRFAADVDMRNLDLELLTRTYSFGTITGRVDASVAGLELVNWQPVKFDARIASSAGEYPRRISQAAVENITALGGGGASAAIQRSFLRFFEQFGYEKLGLRCVLDNNVCEMSGIEDAPQGYLIVKGGGIPAISVIGYNRRVDWQELVARLKRIMQDNVRAIVQ